MVVLITTFPKVAARTRHRIDYLGSGLLALALAAVVLMVSLGGTTYPWASTQVVGLGAITLIALGGFVVAERRAAEPVLPLRLLRNQVFVTAGIVAALLRIRHVWNHHLPFPSISKSSRAPRPRTSRLRISASHGRTTDHIHRRRTDRVAHWQVSSVPTIVGTAIMTVGLFLLSNLSPHTSTLEASAYMFVTGFGIGLVMQVLVVAVQNAVDYQELGVATSGNTLFRNIGSSVGTAIIGTIFATELASHLQLTFRTLRRPSSTSPTSTATLAKLPPAIHETYLAAYASSLDTAFKVAGFCFHCCVHLLVVHQAAPHARHDDHRGSGERFRCPPVG